LPFSLGELGGDHAVHGVRRDARCDDDGREDSQPHVALVEDRALKRELNDDESQHDADGHQHRDGADSVGTDLPPDGRTVAGELDGAEQAERDDREITGQTEAEPEAGLELRDFEPDPPGEGGQEHEDDAETETDEEAGLVVHDGLSPFLPGVLCADAQVCVSASASLGRVREQQEDSFR
jgi:hypothetical protein